MKNLTGMLMAATLAAAGCGGAGTSGDALANATPDVEGLTLEMTGGADEASRAEGNDELTASQQNLATGPEFLQHTREAMKALNGAVKQLVAPIIALAQTTGATGPGGVKTFGPQDNGGATFLLYVKRAGNNFFWRLDAKTIGAADSTYTPVAGGRIKRKDRSEEKDDADADRAHRGRGIIGFDLDALGAIDATFLGRGKLFAAFAHFGEAKMILYRLKGFTPDPATTPPLTAAFYGHRSASGVAKVRVSGLFNVLPGPNGKELMLARAHFIPGIGGRADAILPAVQRNSTSNGDVPAGHYIVAASCWNTQEAEGFKLVRSCEQGKPPSATTCTVLEETGARANCKPDVREDRDGPDDQDDGRPEDGAPGSLDEDAPSGMPGF